jgi:invasion protein IalB
MRLHIAEFPKHSMPFRGVAFASFCSRHEGGPMIAIRFAATVLPFALATTLATSAWAQQPKTAAAPAGDVQPTLLGQYGDWGAYTATPAGARVCFALAKPKTAKTEPPGRKRDPSYIFVSTRPAENVKNEVSVIIGYPFKTSSDATAEIGTVKFAMYTQNDGAWIKNVAEEARMVDAMRKGADLVVTGESGKGTKSTDRYTLKGLSQALDRVAAECK